MFSTTVTNNTKPVHLPAKHHLSLSSLLFWGIMLVVLGGGAAISTSVSADQSQIILQGTLLSTGARITPTAARGSQFESLNPDLLSLPDYQAGQAVSTALSPDGKTLLVLTSGYNRNWNSEGKIDPAASSEYIFVYDVRAGKPVKRQVLEVPNTFSGIAWHPGSQQFFVSGGVDDNIHQYAFMKDKWLEIKPVITLGHAKGLGIDIRPMAAGLAIGVFQDSCRF